MEQTTDNRQLSADNSQQKVIDLTQIFHILWDKRRTFFKVWAVTFILACIWIFPQPRFYTCAVKLAPEMSSDQGVGGLSSLASSFGFNVGGTESQDAIYPMLYPELFENPEFIVGLYDIHVTTKDGKTYSDRVDFPKGEPENPLTDEEFRSRYDGLMEYAGVLPSVSGEVYDIVYKESATIEELVKKL